jgi:DNA invertase Pin-like site-specific DNA recombinase
MVTMLAGIAKFERGLILQRTNEGRARDPGRAHEIWSQTKAHQAPAREALKRVAAGELLREIALSYAVDHSTLSRPKARHAPEV